MWYVNEIDINFNSRLYTRGDNSLYSGSYLLSISIHASTREAILFYYIWKFVCLFQFTPLHERQQFSEFWQSICSYFNSRLCMRGNVLFLTSKLWFPDFNSRLYMRGSRGDWNVRMRVYISIHASTWEAASIGNRQFNHTVISIHASAWEATFRNWNTSIKFYISIHASAWEATPFVLQYGFDTFYFNSRLCMRGNPGAIASGWDTLFQFSPLHERQRRAFLYRYQYLQISIHASTWEATRLSSPDNCDTYISIHASTWEATLRALMQYKNDGISIHASTWEATVVNAGIVDDQGISIHASTWEATWMPSLWTVCARYFNSRLYMRGNMLIRCS